MLTIAKMKRAFRQPSVLLQVAELTGSVKMSHKRQLTYQQYELARAFAERRKSLAAGAWALQWFGLLTFGSETVDCDGRTADYVNTGETYDSTILRENGDYMVGSWGGWLESADAARTEDTGEVRCGYCSAFTAPDTCGNCGNNPSG